MATDMIDFAGLDSVAAAAPVVEAEVPAVEAPVVDAPAADAPEAKAPAAKEQINPDGSPKVDPAVAADLPGTESTPQNIRQALKAMRDADPAKNGAVVKELHGAFERWEASKAIFPKGVAEMKEAKAFIDTVGGHEGLENLQNQVAAINESDELLYAGDPKIIENIVEDLKGQGKLGALAKLAPAFWDALKVNDNDGFYKAFSPHFLSALQDVEMPETMAGLSAALAKGDAAGIAEAKRIVDGMTNWYKGLESKSAQTKADAVSPERVKLDEERKAFAKEQNDFKTNQSEAFKTAVGKESEHLNNQVLGSDLKVYLKMPFFQGFTKENLTPLASQIKQDLFATLKADKAYQAQMKALWGTKNPDRAKIVEYHKAKLESISFETVKNTVQRMYPGYAKGGPAAGRVAAAEVKKAAVVKTDAAAAASGKPVLVAVKPKWEEIDWTKDEKQYLYIAGKAYLKASGKLVTWRK
jgi:hypothetical protein